MNPELLTRLVERVKDDYQFRREVDGWLRGGTCPSCGKREVYTRADGPWLLRCGRLNKCGWESGIKDLYPDEFANFNKRFQPTPQNPNATADAYLRMARGIEPEKVRGWYEQGKFWHPQGDRGTATVRFYLDEARKVYMERFVEEVTVTVDGEKKTRKARFQGSHQGLWWQPPGFEIVAGDSVWLVEGILDAISLNLAGIKAVATLSCVNYPDKMLAEYADTRVTWVWALDHDAAGRKYTLRHVKRMREADLDVAAAQVPASQAKRDWNDLYQRGQLTQSNLDEYRYQGALLIAESASDKALLIYQHDNRNGFPFEFAARLFFFDLNVDKYNKAVEQLQDGDEGLPENEAREKALKQAVAIHEIANCYPHALYYLANPLTDESWYYFRVRFPTGAGDVRNTFTGGQLASASEFKKRLLSIAPGGLFTGTSAQLDRLIRTQIHGIKTVNTIDFLGYSKEFGAYVFPEVCIRDGRTYELNDEDYFDTGHGQGRLAIKSLSGSTQLALRADEDGYQTDWVRQIYGCFGAGGLVALTFWFGSLFAEQIRDVHKSYPFAEIVGEPGAGKTTLIEFLWKLVGRRDYEGFDPSKSTMAARARNFAQVGNLPVSLIEGDRDEDTAHSRKFDWDELKSLYNGRSVRARGLKNSGNETYEPPFRGTVVISQNAPVNASEAILQRIVHLNFTKAGHTIATKALAEALERTPMEAVSHFAVAAALAEKAVMATVIEQTRVFETQFLSVREIKSTRIAKNHAQLLAIAHAMSAVVPLPDGALDAIEDELLSMAIARQRAINADHPTVQNFWDVVDFLGLDRLNHCRDEKLIGLNLPHVYELAGKHQQNLPPASDLKNHLKTSRFPKYLDQKAVASAIHRDEDTGQAKTRKCWVFERRDT